MLDCGTKNTSRKYKVGQKSLKLWVSKSLKKLSKTPDFIRNQAFYGANDVTRTHDLLITNQLLYQLSYISILTCLEPDL